VRAVVQRVSQAAVRVGDEEVARIGAGILALVAIHRRDEHRDLEWMANKLVELRLFDDAEGRLNLSLADVGGELLLVSQFTLYGDCRKGRRPSYIDAAPPDRARALWPELVALVRQRVPGAQEGRFQASMEVSLVNDGPVTLILESPAAVGGASPE
jgi:D-tyrosyl-tRNA(Tyr) deacylase